METVAGEVAAYLGRDPFSADASERLRVTLQGAEESSLAATIELVRADGTLEGHQVLRSRRSECRQLIESLSLAISLALEVQAPSRPTPSLSEPIPTISTPSAVARSSSPPLILAVGQGHWDPSGWRRHRRWGSCWSLKSGADATHSASRLRRA